MERQHCDVVLAEKTSMCAVPSSLAADSLPLQEAQSHWFTVEEVDCYWLICWEVA